MHREIQWQGFVLSAISYDHADLSSSPLLSENIDTSHPFTNLQKSTEFSTLQQSLLPLFRWKIKAGSTIEGNCFHATKQWYSWDYIFGLQTPIPPVSSLSTLSSGLETHLEEQWRPASCIDFLFLMPEKMLDPLIRYSCLSQSVKPHPQSSVTCAPLK